jgi:hypothetical protein
LPEQPELIKRFFSTAFPNPDRKGCPGQTILRAIANNTLPLDHPALAHVASCSPCFSEVERLSNEIKPARRRRFQLLAAAVVIAVLGAVVLWTARRGPVQLPSISQAKKAPTQSVRVPRPQTFTRTPINIPLDLRPFSPIRTVAPPREVPALTVPAELVNLQLTLPLGSDDGSYEVQIEAPGGQVLTRANGRATLIIGDTRLEIILDLSGIAPGNYTMLYRHVDASWHRIPLSITK